MTLEIINSTVVSSTGYEPTITGSHILRDDRYIISTGGTAIRSSGTVDAITIVAAGEIYGDNGGINLRSSAANVDDHSVVVLEPGIVFSDEFNGVEMAGVDAAVTNYGQIVSNGNAGVLFSDDGGVLLNTGSIGSTGINTQYSAAVLMSAGSGFVIDNAGILTSAVTSVGTIEMLSGTGTATIRNSGTILSAGRAIGGSEGAQTVKNSGEIGGDVDLEAGADRYRGIGEGVVTGDVLGGAGSDTLIGGTGDDAFDGGTDNDLVRGRRGDDTLDGGSNEDMLAGGAGDDSLEGSAGNDTLRAGAGDDELDGGDDKDMLYGGQGDDVLSGGDRSDQLFCGAGDDTADGGVGWDLIVGGRGDDWLTGGGGGDTFVFMQSGGVDWITDFELGLDTIDLTAYGFANFASLDLRNTTAGALLDLGDGDIVILERVAVGSLSASDFDL